MEEVITGLVGVSGPVQWAPEARGDLFGILTSALGIFTLLVTAFLFLRPAEPRARLAGADAARIRELLVKQGDRDSLGYFALRDDKSVIWSPTGKSCICYRVVSGVMLASGDPIGDPEAWPGVIGPFLDEARRHAWAPAVMGCSELGAEVWCREGGLTALELGDEAIVNVPDFSLAGRSMRNVRQMVNRVAKHGYVADVRRVGDIPPRELDAIVRVADSWRGSQTERGFSMALGRIGAPGDDECVLATATENGVVRAVLQLVPWGTDGLSLDLMRRDKGAQPGLNDFLITETIKAASDLGVKRISLNFAVFRAALERGERIGAGPVLRAWRSVLIFMSKWFQIESLYKFNAKFCPVWQPRFFVFPSTKDAPRIALAALEAEAFLVWPRLELRRIARKLGLAKLRRQLRRRRRRIPRGGVWGESSPRGSSDARGVPAARPAACRRCLVMGVVNVTPDSFSDGGQWYGADAAIAHGLELAAQGADIVDVGGESTRPGAQRISQEEELRRIGPVVTELVRAGLPVSIDTMRAPVAEFALDAGVQLVNDVSGGLADPDMPRLVAAAGVSYVVMHWRGHSQDMYSRAVYADVVGEVRDELARRVDAVVHAGVDPGCIVLDPGLGFGKRAEHNWPLLTHLAEVGTLAGGTFPVLVGASRKRFLGNLLAGPDGTPRPFGDCDGATVAITALAAADAWCVRVHQVPLNADAVRVAAAWRDAAATGAAGPPLPVVRGVTGRS